MNDYGRYFALFYSVLKTSPTLQTRKSFFGFPLFHKTADAKKKFFLLILDLTR